MTRLSHDVRRPSKLADMQAPGPNVAVAQARAAQHRLARRRTLSFAERLPEKERAVVTALMETFDATLVDEEPVT